MTIKKPIIIFGTGRSGTTLFHQMLTQHPDLSWMSPLCDRFPKQPRLNSAFMHFVEYPIAGKLLRKYIPPGECWDFWEYYSKGFSLPKRDLNASDVNEENKKELQQALSKITSAKRRQLLIKITGWPRLGFLKEIFDDAKFIHIIRDGRAVAASLLKVDFWQGREGPDKWRWGELPAAYNEEWHKYNKSFIVLAAIQWKMLMDAAEQAKKNIKSSNLLEIKYKDLCTDPETQFRKTADFCGLPWSNKFESRLKQYELKNTQDKWKRGLSASEQKDLNEVLEDYLKKYGCS